MGSKIKGLFLTTILSFTIVLLFFGKIFQDPNNYYFSADGDGFKAYYGAIYHLKYDTSALQMNGMNYPYGEMVVFTGSQPLVVNTVKFLSKNGIGSGENIVGIINLLMLLSIVIAALFLFLIFYELEVHWLFAVFASIGICMLSPQIARFGGHFSLSWLFWIPFMIYLILRFDKKPGYLFSILIGCVTFLAGAMHMYFYGFYGFIIGLYLIAQVFHKHRKFGVFKGLGFFALQFILPFILFQTIIVLNDSVSDRTIFPYGFWAYMGHPLGVFLPNGQPYAFVPKLISAFRHVQWESWAFIGLTSLVAFCAGTIGFVRKSIKKQNPFAVTDRFVLNVLFWSSFIALLFSFGLPFKLGLEGLVDKIGQLRQFRALARFSWLFFYVLNIIAFYVIYHKVKTSPHSLKWRIIALFALGILFFDGYWNCHIHSDSIQNRKSELEDRLNELPQNDWVNKINPKEFQAILPLPYFHVGSENIWIDSKQNTQELAMVASLKTGLPLTAVQLSRTSIGQTYNNYALVTEPLEPFKVLDDFPNEKPLLLLFNRKHYANENEIRLIQAGELLYQNEKIELRKLDYSKLKKLREEYVADVHARFHNTILYKRENKWINDSSSVYIHESFDEFVTEKNYSGEGALTYEGGNWKTVLDDTLRVEAGKKYKLSFWMSDYKEDGYLRAIVEFTQRDPETNNVNNYFFSDAHRHIKAFQNTWALIEISFETKSANESIKLAVKNSIVKDKMLVLDELVIREKGIDLFYPAENPQFFNGRKLPEVFANKHAH